MPDWPNEDDQLAIDLVDLVVFLARPYGDNRPVFATEDFQGNPMPHGQKLERTWDLIFGKKEPTPGKWHRCPECKIWRVVNGD